MWIVLFNFESCFNALRLLSSLARYFRMFPKCHYSGVCGVVTCISINWSYQQSFFKKYWESLLTACFLCCFSLTLNLPGLLSNRLLVIKKLIKCEKHPDLSQLRLCQSWE